MFVPDGLNMVVAHSTKLAAVARFVECLEMIQGPPPTWPVVIGVWFSHCSGIAAAICPARLGASVTWIGRLGCDATGDLIERRLCAEGVRVHAIREGGFTGLMVRHRRVAGHTSVDYHRAGSASARLCSGDIPGDLLAGAAILHVTGITPALSESARQAVFDVAERAREL